MHGPPRREFDPPPATPIGWLGRVWVVGAAVLVEVVVLVALLPSPGLLGGLFVWTSSAAFSVWLLHEHRDRLPRGHRLALAVLCAAVLVALLALLAL